MVQPLFIIKLYLIGQGVYDIFEEFFGPGSKRQAPFPFSGGGCGAEKVAVFVAHGKIFGQRSFPKAFFVIFRKAFKAVHRGGNEVLSAAFVDYFVDVKGAVCDRIFIFHVEKMPQA